MKSRSTVLPALFTLATLLPATAAFANTITQFDGSLSSSNPTQLGRLSRSGVPSSWDTTKAYPGQVNPAVSYYYTTYTLASSLFAGGQYVQIEYYDYDKTGAEFYLSAYANSYNSTSKGTNFLGDAGSSPNAFGTDTVYFNIFLPASTNLILVLNETIGSGAHALNKPFNIQVENFSSTSFDDPLPVVSSTPEPSSFILLGTGVVGMIGAARRKFSV